MKNKRRRDRRLMKQAREAASTLPTEKSPPKITVSPEKDPGPHKKETPASLKRKTHRVKAPNKVQGKSGDKIPLLVPVEKKLPGKKMWAYKTCHRKEVSQKESWSQHIWWEEEKDLQSRAQDLREEG